MKKNIQNIKSFNLEESLCKAGSAVNNFFSIDYNAPFCPFIQSPISNILDFINSSGEYELTSWSAADDNNEVNISFEREKNSEPKI